MTVANVKSSDLAMINAIKAELDNIDTADVT